MVSFGYPGMRDCATPNPRAVALDWMCLGRRYRPLLEADPEELPHPHRQVEGGYVAEAQCHKERVSGAGRDLPE
jgi:hypothetical protein